MSTEADILTRLKKVEKQVEVLLDLHPDAQDRLRPRDAMATCDAKGVLGPGLITCEASEAAMVEFHFAGDMAKTVVR